MTDRSHRLRRLTILAAATMAAVGGMQSATAATTAAHTPTAPALPARASTTPPAPPQSSPLPAPPTVRPADDIIVNGYGDGDGYQILIADANHPTRWRHLATLAPSLGTDDTWVGRQCVT